MGSTINLVLTTNLPQSLIEGTKFLCRVLSMAFENNTISAGMSKNTVSILSAIALVSTRPISMPIPNCISIRASMPDIVVRLLEEISTIALLSASFAAGIVSRASLSSINL